MKPNPTKSEIEAFRRSLDRGIQDSENDRGRPMREVVAELLARLDSEVERLLATPRDQYIPLEEARRIVMAGLDVMDDNAPRKPASS